MNLFIEKIKNYLRKSDVILKNYKRLKVLKKKSLLRRNYKKDYLLYKKHSLAFNLKTFVQKEAEFIIQYHGIEKGMLHVNMKPKFAKSRIQNLHTLLADNDLTKSVELSQIRVGLQVICKYYELHKVIKCDISDYYTDKQYNRYKSILDSSYDPDFDGILNFDKESFYKDNLQSFDVFSKSRKSIRDFTGEKVNIDILYKAISLANHAPSVCNRQSNKVYLIEDKSLIDRSLNIQGGFSGYTDNVQQLLILTNDRSAYYTIGERNQLFIDGGIYLMNLLYALHFYKIANCPANWGKTIQEEQQFNDVILLPAEEKIICMIPIGIAKEKFRTTLSERRTVTENFKVLD